MVFVEAADIVGQVVLGAKGRGNEHKHGLKRTPPGDGEELEGVVEAGGVTAARLDDRVEQGQVGGLDAGAGQVGLAGADPVAVSAEGVDLPVVGEHPEGMGEGPGGKGVGAVALVEDGQGGFKGRILQIGIKAPKLGAGEHAFVDDHAGAEGGDVEGGSPVGRAAVLNLVAGEEEEQLERVVGKFFCVRPGKEELFDLRGRRGGFFPQNAQVDGHGAPAEHLETAAGDHLLGDAPDVGLGVVVGSGKKEDADAEIAVRVESLTQFFHFAPEKFGGDLGEDAGTVAGFGVGIQGPAVGQLADAPDGPIQDRMGFASLDIRDEPDAAGIVLVGGMIEALGRGKPVVQRELGHGRSKGTGDGVRCKKEVGNPLEDQRFSGNSRLWPHREFREAVASARWWYVCARGGRATGVWPWFSRRFSGNPGYGRCG